MEIPMCGSKIYEVFVLQPRRTESLRSLPLFRRLHGLGRRPLRRCWNSWNIGVRAERVSSAIVQPEPKEPVYICGEAYSRYQGWVEGALATAEDLLQSKFGLPSPSWYKPDWEQPELWQEEAEALAKDVDERCEADGVPPEPDAGSG